MEKRAVLNNFAEFRNLTEMTRIQGSSPGKIVKYANMAPSDLNYVMGANSSKLTMSYTTEDTES